MSLLRLANELLLCILKHLELEGDINAFSQTNRRLHNLLNTYLYRHNVQRLGGSGLRWAARYEEEATARKFLEVGADIQKSGQSLHLTDDEYGHEEDRTPLSWAAENGNEIMVKLLLEKGAEVNVKDTECGQTPLSLAARRGHEAVAKLLLKKGAEMDIEDDSCRTPLSWAAGNGYEAVVKLLLENGAEIGRAHV